MYNSAVHRAFVNYMYEHQGDIFRLISDNGNYDECDDYEEIDLLNYKFNNSKTTKEIIADLNLIYADSLYGIRNGVGYDERQMSKPARLWARAVFSLAKFLIDFGYRLAYYQGS